MSKIEWQDKHDGRGQEHWDSRSILDQLACLRIVDFRLKGSKVRIEEQCDYHFKVEVSADTIRALAQELIELADEADGVKDE